MKENKGFTLIELLAVIVVLGIIMTIATNLVINNINDSKKRAKFIAAKEITEIASVYMATEYHEESCVGIDELIEKEYLEKDVTNPETGENGNINASHLVCKNSSLICDEENQDEYDVCSNEQEGIKFYIFNEYVYQYTYEE